MIMNIMYVEQVFIIFWSSLEIRRHLVERMNWKVSALSLLSVIEILSVFGRILSFFLFEISVSWQIVSPLYNWKRGLLMGLGLGLGLDNSGVWTLLTLGLLLKNELQYRIGKNNREYTVLIWSYVESYNKNNRWIIDRIDHYIICLILLLLFTLLKREG